MEKGVDTHFAVNGVTFTASSGDSGSGVEYPAASPDVVSVGGTTLSTDKSGSYVGETAWSAAIDASPYFSSLRSEPRFQQLIRRYRR